VQDQEPKYGLVVIGFLDPRQMLTKGGLRPGDALVLTKPLGFGVTTTALKRGQADEADVREVVQWMTRLNKTAGELAVEFGLRGGTDVTGFSLLGHASEMAAASGVALRLDYAQTPFIPFARKYAELGAFPGGAFDNQHYYKANVKFTKALSEPEEMLLFDPQTSGGLLLGVPEKKLGAFQTRAQESEQPMWIIGEVREGEGIVIV
jgi:selenide,water dikinase